MEREPGRSVGAAGRAAPLLLLVALFAAATVAAYSFKMHSVRKQHAFAGGENKSPATPAPPRTPPADSQPDGAVLPGDTDRLSEMPAHQGAPIGEFVARLIRLPPRAPPVAGRMLYRQCRATGQGYWFYAPVNYNRERRYPLVVTLHSMKPHDGARHHVQMWAALADKFRYCVLAPELKSPDGFGQVPLRKMGPAETRDVQHILACIEEVAGDWEVDRNSLLLSSWSMGGYLAHYVATEHGGRFAAFAPLQSNFCGEPLDATKARQWAGKLPVFIFFGTADFPAVTNECKQAVEWYNGLGYKVQEKVEPIGHRRRPELAAEFFESVLAGRMKTVEIVVTPPRPEPAPLAVNLFPMLSSRIPEVRTYLWDFGPLGGPSYQKSPNLLIRQPGKYRVRLTVTDKAGQQHVAETELVVPPAAPVQGPRNQPQP